MLQSSEIENSGSERAVPCIILISGGEKKQQPERNGAERGRRNYVEPCLEQRSGSNWMLQEVAAKGRDEQPETVGARDDNHGNDRFNRTSNIVLQPCGVPAGGGWGGG